ncbi:hypothetical protein BSLG_005739 [Batrachochytrium salamandrivorans]|nr:hypothetical protein BSLG_005739 [Batrachochytrium salamandrivorans]
MGIDDVLNFEFIDPPDPDLVIAATKQLFLLSMLSSEEVFSTPRSKKRQSEADEAHQRFYHYSGDHMTLLQVYNAWVKEGYSRDWCIQNYLHYRALKNAKSIRSQLVDIMKRLHRISDIAKMNQLDWVVYNDIQVKLLNVSKLLGNEPRKSILSEADKDVGSDDGSNTIPVGFDLVEEVIDEQHHTEHPAGDSDKEPAVPTVQVHERLQLHPAGKHNTLGDEDKTMRQEKIDSARDRFLKH